LPDKGSHNEGKYVFCISIKNAELINDHMLYLNIHASVADKDYDLKDSTYEESEHEHGQSQRNHMNILLGDFNTKTRLESISNQP
jgi:hypothetical protein